MAEIKDKDAAIQQKMENIKLLNKQVSLHLHHIVHLFIMYVVFTDIYCCGVVDCMSALVELQGSSVKAARQGILRLSSAVLYRLLVYSEH